MNGSARTADLPFVLAPYPGLSFPEDVRVSGVARREGSELHLTWLVEAPEGAIALPAAAAAPQRRTGLWEETCFEFFLASQARGYWEFNLSPSGDWAVFRFDGYRSGMRDEAAFAELPFAVTRWAGGCKANIVVDMRNLGLGDAPWELAIAAVVREPGGRLTYWALAHPEARPDFHAAGAFCLRLA